MAIVRWGIGAVAVALFLLPVMGPPQFQAAEGRGAGTGAAGLHE